MKKLNKKNLIILGSIGGAVLIGAIVVLILLLRKPNPAALLEQTQIPSEQNLCLMAILEKEPQNKEAQKQLLENYQKLGADPLTIEATRQKFGYTEPPAEVTPSPEDAGAILNTGGIAKMSDYKGAYAVAKGNSTVYYATDQGIYADYQGLRVCIGSIRAEGLLAAEGGVYFINLHQKRVQYLARDGHKLLTLSDIEAQSFTFYKEKLWIASTDGTLYCEGEKIETPAPIRSLSAGGDRLFAACNDEQGNPAGAMVIDANGNCTYTLTSPAYSIFAGNDGCLYYLNKDSFPCRFDPAQKKSEILLQKSARAVTLEEGTIYYLNEKGQVKKIA